MKDKVKRRRIVNQRKVKDLWAKYNNQGSEINHNNLALEKEKQKLEQQQNDYDQLSIAKLKFALAKKRAKELNKEFLKTKRSEFKSYLDFLKSYKESKLKRKQILDVQKDNYLKLRNIYSEKYETTSFKIKRWFFGMGKEFSRVRWADKKLVLTNFVIVIGISAFLAIIFFIIDFLFTL